MDNGHSDRKLGRKMLSQMDELHSLPTSQMDSHMHGKMDRQWRNKLLENWTYARTGGRAARWMAGHGGRAPGQSCPDEVPLLAQAIHCRGVTS